MRPVAKRMLTARKDGVLGTGSPSVLPHLAGPVVHIEAPANLDRGMGWQGRVGPGWLRACRLVHTLRFGHSGRTDGRKTEGAVCITAHSVLLRQCGSFPKTGQCQGRFLALAA